MTKSNILWLILKILFIIMFNILFFTLGGSDHLTSVWISYGFIHFAYLSLIFTPYLVNENNNVVMGMPLYLISTTYFFTMLFFGVLFILLQLESSTIVFLIQFVITIIYFVIFVSNVLANEDTKNKLDKHINELNYIKSSSSKLKILIPLIQDKLLQKKIENTFDLIQSSPAKSHIDVINIEKEVIVLIINLEKAINTSDLISVATLSDKILKLADKRNSKLALLNK